LHARGPRSAHWNAQEASSEAESRARDDDESAAITAQMLAEFSEVEQQGKLGVALEDLHWRLRHLYWIIDKKGNKVLFVPKEQQLRLIDNVSSRNLILKARQLGYSTAIQLLMLDSCLFIPNISAAVSRPRDVAASRSFLANGKAARDLSGDHIRDTLNCLKPKTIFDIAAENETKRKSGIREDE
jgi:hypothetical protein